MPPRKQPTRRHVFLSALAAIVLVSLPAFTQAPQAPGVEVTNGHRVAAGEVLVKLHDQGGPAEVADIARDIDADSHRPVGGAGVRLFHSRHFTAAELIDRLSKRPTVAYVEPDYLVQVLQIPSDPRFNELWGLQNLGQAVNGGTGGTPGADVHAVSAWQITTGSRNALVGVVDTGIDYTHRDLAANVWSAPVAFTVTIGGVAITCAAGTHGFNAITKTCDPMDDHGHGTHVSGTIGAVGNNDIGVVGVNWTAAIIGAKFLDQNGSGTTADAIDALEFLIQAKGAFAATAAADVRVLSNSWGGDAFSQALLDEINRTAENQMLFVAAAGNSGLPNDLFPTYPASYQAPNIISVAATDNDDALAWFSNYGQTTVHLGAPGVDILSTTLHNTYAFLSGTSMATPHVSGAAALVLSACTLDTASVKAAVVDTVDQVPGLTGRTISGGRLNVTEALRACTVAPAAPTGLTATPGDGRVTLAWTRASGAMTYNVKRGTTSGGPYTTSGTATGVSYVDKGLTNDVTYYYVVSAVNLVSESANSIEAAATPKAPTDLVVSTLTVPSVAGAGQTISASDTTKNQGSGAAPATVTRFYLSTNVTFDTSDTPLDGSRAVPPLAGGASSTGSTALTMPSGLAVGTYYVIARADADNATVESSETNNTTARAIAVGPDLVVSALQVPSTVAPGSVISVSDTIKNQGGGASGASTTRFYLSTNASFDVSDTLLDGARSVGPLASGASSTGSTSVTIPASLAVGTYYLFAKADADNAVAETSETNNTMLRATQSGPDLVVSALTAPSAGSAGSTILVSDTTTNQGSSLAGASTTRFYLSANASLDASDTLLDGSRAVPALNVGVSSSGSTSVTIPAGTTAGTYYVFAKSDADGVVAETSETNNTAIRAIQVGPDLVVSSLQAPAAVAAGAVVTITDTVTNQGAGAAGASTSRFYLSLNAALDSNDTLLDGNRAVPALAAGQSSSGSTSITVPAGLSAGTYYIVARADADGFVTETSETNNTAVRAIQVGPDLVVSALQAPAAVAAGAVVTITDTVTNQGAGSAAASTTRFYLSLNASFDSSDTLLDGGRAVPALAAGQSSSGSTSITVPAGLSAGTYYIVARADADGAVAETSETNNTAVRAIQVGPDLVISALQVPSIAAAGSVVQVTDTVKNQGAGAAGASTTTFYLSVNASLDTSDTLLDGSRTVAALSAGSSDTGTTAVTIPATVAAGTWYIFAKADGGNAVVETSESNNAAVRAVQVGPDLIVSALSAPSSATSGGTIVVADTVKNQGAAPAGSSTTRFYLSSNLSLDASDPLLNGSRVVGALAGGASSSGSTTVTIPSGLPAGTYYLFAKADADGVVAESSETNNAFVRAVQVTAAAGQ